MKKMQKRLVDKNNLNCKRSRHNIGGENNDMDSISCNELCNEDISDYDNHEVKYLEETNNTADK